MKLILCGINTLNCAKLLVKNQRISSQMRNTVSNECLGVSDITSILKKQIRKMTRKEEAKPEKKKRRKYGVTCDKCDSDEILSIGAMCCDGGVCVLPSGKENNGYLLSFTGLSNSDGAYISICASCGNINGLNLEKLRKEIDECEASYNNNDSDEDDLEDDLESGSDEENDD